jgi:hypothetical protein
MSCLLQSIPKTPTFLLLLHSTEQLRYSLELTINSHILLTIHFLKVWGLGSTTPYFTLEGHEKGVNCVEYFFGGDKPYLVSGADDK